MARDELNRHLVGAGAEHVQEQAPEVVTVDDVNAWTEREERVLRLQDQDGTLFGRYEAELQALDTTTMTGALRRWALVKHLFRVRSEGLERRGPTAPEAEEAARKLLRREPEVVWLAGHRVEVTGRSYSAMTEIAAHQMRIQILEQEREDLSAQVASIRMMLATIPVLHFGRRKPLRSSLREVVDAYARVSTEHELHRASLYAHALTPSGAPAKEPVKEAPEWWRELGPEDDARLLQALWQVGPGRYAELGPTPKPEGKGGKAEFVENLGFASLFRVWEPKMELKPAELYDRDLAQTLTAIRAASIEYPELET